MNGLKQSTSTVSDGTVSNKLINQQEQYEDDEWKGRT
jgi:hypothetical protein